jgi:hypothetical protein
MVPPSAVLPTGENFGFTTQKVPNKNETSGKTNLQKNFGYFSRKD